MKRKNLMLFFLTLIVASAISLSLFSSFTTPDGGGKPKKKKQSKTVKATPTSPQAGCTTSCDVIITDCYASPTVGGCPSAGCTSVWKVPNVASVTHLIKTVTITGMVVCYVPSGTPPWSSLTQIGKIMDPTCRPSATYGPITFPMTAATGQTFNCTVYPSGDLYFKLVSGTAPSGPGATLSGSYTPH